MNTTAGGIDLHTHSTASDGALTPTELVHAASDNGVETLALTDHDTTGGLAEAKGAAAAHGIRLVPGVEISVTWQRRTLHIVGLAFDSDSSGLNTGLARLQLQRRTRAETIAAKLEKTGVADALEKAERLANGGQITRAHFARLLIDAGLCRTMAQCFKRYLKPGKPAYASVEWAGLTEAIGWIHDAGGLAVLAHPLGYGMSAAWRDRMHAAFSQTGGDAVEVCCGASSPERLQTSVHAALKYGLLGSAGTDFHSPAQRWLRLGRLPRMPETVTPIWTHARFAAG